MRVSDGRKTYHRVLMAALFTVAGALLVWQAIVKAPASDEVANLISGVAMWRTGDPAYYRVNPPLHRLVSGLAVEAIEAPDLPGLYPASAMGSGARHEFRFSEEVIAAHPHDYRRFFYIGRLVRIPFILLAGWWLFRGVPPALRTAGAIAGFLWLTSPLVLGHGWVVMPDAFSGCAMVVLLIGTLSWLNDRTWENAVLVGVGWGISIGTKFTFGPVYVMWPLGLLAHQVVMGKRDWRNLLRVCLAHVGQGFIALLIVIGLYGGADLGVRFKDHGFQSERLTQWTDPDAGLIGRVLGPLPSPLPKQFLVGVDEQQMDLERGHKTYFSGTWYPNGMWWYYLAGLLAKEQLLFALGLVPGVIGGCLLGLSVYRSGERAEEDAFARERLAAWWLCLLAAAEVLGLLSLHSRMALNVRYAFPALPPLLLLIGIGTEQMAMRMSGWARRRAQAGESSRGFGWNAGTLILAVLVGVSGIELASNSPHFFAYANPLFGGSYRVPPVLHDSNFDGAQDLWLLERWLADHPLQPGQLRYTCIHGDVPIEALSFVPTPPREFELKRLLAERREEPQSSKPESTEPESDFEVLVMRGLGNPALWMQLQGSQEGQASRLVRDLALLPPDEFLSPTLAIYRSKQHSPSTK